MSLLDGLVAAYEFDGDSTDAHTGGRDWIDLGVAYEAGKIGQAAVARDDPASPVLYRESAFVTSGSLAMELWFKPKTEVPLGGLFWEQFEYGGENTLFLQFSTEMDNIDFTYTGEFAAVSYSSPTPLLDQWWHVIAVYDNAAHTLSLYVNGILRDRTTAILNLAAHDIVSLGGEVSFPDPQVQFPSPYTLYDLHRVWSRVPTDGGVSVGQTAGGEVALLWAGGDGLSYPQFAVAPVAAFTGTPLSGTAPVSVAFVDASTDTPTSWLWEKNSGSGWVNFTTSPTLQHPTEAFTAGTWSVRLTATNAGGSDTLTRETYIIVAGPTSTRLVFAAASKTNSVAGRRPN